MKIQSLPWIRIVLWCLCVFPPALAAWTTYRYAVFVPGDDFLEYLPLSESILKNGYPTFSVLFTGINEHIIFSFNLIFALFGMLHPALLPPSKASLILYTILSHLSVLGSALLLSRIAVRTHTAQTAIWKTLVLFTAVVVLFSPVPWVSWVQPYVGFTVIVTAVLAVLFILYVKPHSWIAFTGAAVLAVLASFGLLFGFAIWPAALPVLLAQKPKKRAYLPLLVWIAIGLLCVLIFLSTRLEYHQDLHEFELWSFIRFTLILLGSSLSESWYWAGIYGIVMCCVLLFSLWSVRRSLREASPWIGLVTFGVAAALLISFGRAGFGREYALQARYVIFTSIPWIGTLYLLALSRRNRLLTLAVLCVLYLHLSSWPRMLPRFHDWHGGQTWAENCLQFYETASDECLGLLRFGPTYADSVRKGARKMEELHLFFPDRSVKLDGIPAE